MMSLLTTILVLSLLCAIASCTSNDTDDYTSVCDPGQLGVDVKLFDDGSGVATTFFGEVIFEGTYLDSKAELVCVNGYQQVGSVVRVCTERGWSGVVQSCLPWWLPVATIAGIIGFVLVMVFVVISVRYFRRRRQGDKHSPGLRFVERIRSRHRSRKFTRQDVRHADSESRMPDRRGTAKALGNGNKSEGPQDMENTGSHGNTQNEALTKSNGTVFVPGMNEEQMMFGQVPLSTLYSEANSENT